MSGDPPVILVDNGSSDGTPEAVERAFPNVSVLRAGAEPRRHGPHRRRARFSNAAGRRRLQARNALLSSWLRRPLPVALADTVQLAMQGGDPQLRRALLDAARKLPAALADRRLLPPSVEAHLRLLRRGM